MTTVTRQKPTTPRARVPKWEKAFLSCLAKWGVITAACEAAGIHRSTAYDRREADEAFEKAWDDAQKTAADLLEIEARRRAVRGVLKPVYQTGKRVGYVREYSDTLMARLLEANNPEKFRRHTDITSGGEKIPIAVVKMDVDEL